MEYSPKCNCNVKCFVSIPLGQLKKTCILNSCTILGIYSRK